MSFVVRASTRVFSSRLACAGVAIALCFAGPADAATSTTSGVLPVGTAYRMDVPDNWNGTVLIGLDYAGRTVPGDPPRFVDFTPPALRPYTPCDLERDLGEAAQSVAKRTGKRMPRCVARPQN